MKTEKLQKVLARAGVGSRRMMEEWISQGRVQVNGALATLGMRVSDEDKIKVNGRFIKFPESTSTPRVILYHKPAGEVCTRKDPEGRATVFEALPKHQTGRWVSIGRLDYNTAGLLMFTDSGEFANQLMHPSANLEREYAVRLFGVVDPAIIKKLKEGVALEDGFAKFENIIDAGGQGSNHWYHVIVKEGRNRIVRRLWESEGITVSRLIRVRFGPVALPRRLPQGKWQELTAKEITDLMKALKKRTEPNS
jgi:23S rRNA pseudouridine2605 synthase